MRRFALLAALLLPLLAPGTAMAGGCPPGVPEGVVDKDVYRLGEIVDFFDSYHDFADPGTVTITFERPSDGASRTFTASNGPDGTWYSTVTFDTAADAGIWNVTVVVDQTGSLDTCSDRFTVVSSGELPPTDGQTDEAAGTHSAVPGWVALIVLGGAIGSLGLRRRRRGSGARI